MASIIYAEYIRDSERSKLQSPLEFEPNKVDNKTKSQEAGEARVLF